MNKKGEMSRKSCGQKGNVPEKEVSEHMEMGSRGHQRGTWAPGTGFDLHNLHSTGPLTLSMGN